MKRLLLTLFCIALIFSGFVAVGKELPKLISITTFKVGSLGYTITSAFREAVERYTPMKVRVEPYGTDVARILPLKIGESEITLATAPQAVSASYGLLNFSTDKWGPQPIRIVWRGMTLYVGCFVRADSDIQSYKDLKGKRVPVIPGSAAYKANMTAHLAFGGLTWDDVKQVVCSSFMDVYEAFLGGKIDVVFSATSPPRLKEVVKSRHGARWLPLPHSDQAAWQRLQETTPWNVPAVLKKGPGVKAGESVEMGSFAYSLYAYDHADDDVIHAYVMSMHKGYDTYKKMHKVLPLWSVEQAVTNPSPLPYHPGAIKYYKEAGVWTDKMDKWQAEQIKSFNERLANWKK